MGWIHGNSERNGTYTCSKHGHETPCPQCEAEEAEEAAASNARIRAASDIEAGSNALYRVPLSEMGNISEVDDYTH